MRLGPSENSSAIVFINGVVKITIMPTKFKSFEEFGQATKQAESENLRQQVDDIFEKSIKDDFESIPEGPFKSSFPEINWIAFARPKDRKTGENNPNVVNAVIFSKTESGKDINHTWTINKNGGIRPIQDIPVDLAQKYSQEQIALELVGLLEKINPAFVHFTNLDIIPLQDKGESREVTPGPKGPPVEKPIDPNRVHFLQTIRGAEFEFANEEKQFRGYTGIVFDGAKNGFIYLENQYIDNAAYIVDLSEPVDMEMVERELRQETPQDDQDKITKKQIRDKAVDRYWKPISDKAKTRKELMGLGIAEKVVHKDPKVWQDAIRKAIETRTGA